MKTLFQDLFGVSPVGLKTSFHRFTICTLIVFVWMVGAILYFDTESIYIAALGGRLAFFGILTSLLVILSSPGRPKQTNVVQIDSEEGGKTEIMKDAINIYLRSVLSKIDGVNKTYTDIDYGRNNYNVKITVNMDGLKSRSALVKEIRETTRETLTQTLGIPNVQNINVCVKEFKYVDSNKNSGRKLLDWGGGKKAEETKEISVSQTESTAPNAEDDDSIELSTYDAIVEGDEEKTQEQTPEDGEEKPNRFGIS